MRPEAPDATWLPLGNAQIIDWDRLGRSPSARGAAVWAGTLAGESVLVRIWCEETTTHFEFVALTRPAFAGEITVQVIRPDPQRVRVEAHASAQGSVEFRETFEFVEHPRTGLQAAATRACEVHLGDCDPLAHLGLSPAEAEILEYAPESALHTGCADWLASVLSNIGRAIRDQEVIHAPQAHTPPPRRGPTNPQVRPLEVPVVEAQQAPQTPAAPPHPASAATPKPVRAERLFAATNAGDSWELTEDETYVGRSKQCTVVLKSQRVSRKHASITREPQGWFINDLGAANGIWAGTDKVDREVIEDGAEYVIGDVLLTFTFS